MLSVASHLLTTLQGIFSEQALSLYSVEDRLDDIRQAMLDGLGLTGGLLMSQIERRVMFAPDAQSLWYLRPELLIAMSEAEGERLAQEKIDRISRLFEGLLPPGMSARTPRMR